MFTPPPIVAAACFPGTGLITFAFVELTTPSAPFPVAEKDSNTLMPFNPVTMSLIPDGASFLLNSQDASEPKESYYRPMKSWPLLRIERRTRWAAANLTAACTL